jgi:hypothetical protein
MVGSLDEFLAQQVRLAVDKVVEEKVVSKLERPGVEIGEREAAITLKGGATLAADDIPALMAYHGLSPDEWVGDRVIANKWQSAAKINDEWVKTDLRQLKVMFRPNARRLLGIEPARTDGPRYEPVDWPPTPADGHRLYAILPDQQIPHHDRPLHQLVLRWLDHNLPHGIVCSGDVIDLPTISKHRHNPHMVPDHDRALQRGIDETYDVLAGYVQASPSPYRKIIPGNHEERFQNFLIERAPQLHGVKRAGEVDRHSAFSIPHLIRSDELGYDWVTAPNGAEWPDAELVLSPHLAIRHGWLAKKGSGATALATLDHLGYSVIVGHTHRQSQVFKTVKEISGAKRVLTALEAGALAQPDLGYTAGNADWQQGFAVVRMFSNGTFDASLAKYLNGELIWEGQRYQDRGPLGVRVAA